jgi:hypothetical protein
MLTEQKLLVKCPKCPRQYAVSFNDEQFSCTECGGPFAIAKHSLPTASIHSLQETVAEITKQLEQSEPLPPEQKKLLRQLDEAMSLIKVAIMQLDISYVPRDVVHLLNEADREMGIMFGIFTFFLGLAIQEGLNKGLTSVVTIMVLVTALSGAATAYCFLKARQRKQNIEEGAVFKPLRVVLGGRPETEIQP